MIFPNYWQDETAIPIGMNEGGKVPTVGKAGGTYAASKAISSLLNGGNGDLGIFLERQKNISPLHSYPQGQLNGGPRSGEAAGIASLGRGGDTMLMHVTPDEVNSMAHSINPETGLPEAFPPLIPILMGLLPSVIGGAGGLSGAIGLTGAISSATGLSAGTAGTIGSALLGGVGSFAGGSIKGAIEGKSAGEALKEGLISGATSVAAAGVGAGLGAAASAGTGAATEAATQAATEATTGIATDAAAELAADATSETVGDIASAAAESSGGSLSTGSLPSGEMVPIDSATQEVLRGQAGEVVSDLAESQALQGVTDPVTGEAIATEAGKRFVDSGGYEGLGGEYISPVEAQGMENVMPDGRMIEPSSIVDSSGNAFAPDPTAGVEGISVNLADPKLGVEKAIGGAMESQGLGDWVGAGKGLGQTPSEVLGSLNAPDMNTLKLALANSGSTGVGKLQNTLVGLVPGQGMTQAMGGGLGSMLSGPPEWDYDDEGLGPAGSGYPGSSPAGRGGGYPTSKSGSYLDPELYKYSSGGGGYL